MQVVRVGVIGVGGMGSFHARTLAALSDVEVVAVADPFEPNRRAIADELGCRSLADPMALATDDAVDGLVIASPDETHADLAIAAIRRGTYVLCEKPLATTIDDALAVANAEQASGRNLVQLGFMRQYDPAHTQVFAALPELGAIDYVRAVHRNANSSRRPIAQIIGQSMVHDIHTVRFVTGCEITKVRAFGSGPSDGSFRHVVAVCTLSSGAHAVIEFDDGGFGYDVGLEILGRSGDVLLGPPTRAVIRRQGSLDVHLGDDWFAWFADAYRIQDQAWVDSIRAGEAVGPSVWDGVIAQAVVEAVLASLTHEASVAVTQIDVP
jgi:myo-inositol 2-dehydrogenase/D-chiro-inositol 1-dehydrogenase